MINDVGQAEQTEALDEKELEKRTIDTIVALVNQARDISTEDSTLHEYKDAGDPKNHINDTGKQINQAVAKYSQLKGMKKAHFWTIGRNKAKVERTQEVLDDIIEAVNNNANATKALFNNQVKLAVFSQKLYAIGIMGIASNRLVVREIKKRLEHASKEELNELARQELETLMYELQKQQEIENKIEDIEKLLISNKEETDAIITEIKECQNQLELHVDEKQKAVIERIEDIEKLLISNKKETDAIINEIKECHNQLELYVDENQKVVIERIEDISKTITNNKNEIDARVNEVKELTCHLRNYIDDNLKNLNLNINAHDRRLSLLEIKSFLDSSIYKIFVGITALIALIISSLTLLL